MFLNTNKDILGVIALIFMVAFQVNLPCRDCFMLFLRLFIWHLCNLLLMVPAQGEIITGWENTVIYGLSLTSCSVVASYHHESPWLLLLGKRMVEVILIFKK